MPTVSKRITNARQSLGLTQRELSKKTQIAEPTLSRYESGYRTPNLEAITKISKALDVSPNYLILGKENDTSNNKPNNETIEEILLDFSTKLKNCIETNNLSYKNTKLYPEHIEAIIANTNLEFLRAKLECKK